MRATRQVVAIHGGLDQEERHEAIRSFKEGSKVRGFLIFFAAKWNSKLGRYGKNDETPRPHHDKPR